MLVICQLGRAREQLDRVLHLIAAPGELSGTSTPRNGLPSKAFELSRVVAPDEVGVLRPDRLGIVVGEERGMLVLRSLSLVQPVGEGRVQAAAARFRDARVRHLARQGVLDRVLLLPGNRRSAAVPDEVALLEQVEVGLDAVEKMDDRRGPEDATDDRCRLKRCLLHGGETIDTGREHRMDTVRHREPFGKDTDGPAAVSPQDACVDESRDELFDEEGIALGAGDQELSELRRQLDGQELVEHA